MLCDILDFPKFPPLCMFGVRDIGSLIRNNEQLKSGYLVHLNGDCKNRSQYVY